MMRRWVCGIVVVAVVFGSLGWSAPAIAEEPLYNIVHEFLVGEIGAVGGGVFGIFVALSNSNRIFVSSNNINGTLIWGMGRTVGASLGVIWAGNSLGVQGNLLVAFLLPGVAMTIFPITALLLNLDIDANHLFAPLETSNLFGPLGILAFPYLPFVPAAFATLGYNIGAKMKDTGQPASLPWTLDLPVLWLQF